MSLIKPSEEGRIWEWRAFGRVTAEMAARVRGYPIRMGISDLRGEDIYLVPPHSNQNIKLRRYAGGWVLKFKLLFETSPGSFELYGESAALTYLLPVALENVQEAARLLEVKLPDSVLSATRFTRESFLQALAASSPQAAQASVSKKRSQYLLSEEGWVELADAKFAKQSTQSISVQSPRLESVKEILQLLRPGVELEAMNYVEACRRWGFPGNEE